MQSRQQVHCQRARGQGFDLERETETIRTQACRPAKNQWPVLTRNPNPLAKPMQEGSGAFSYSHSQLGTVIRYIQNQEKHHARKTFHDEYQALLDRFQVPHDERYVFKPIE